MISIRLKLSQQMRMTSLYLLMRCKNSKRVKQFARDWLKANPDNDWTLPDEIVEKTIDKYLQSYEMLTGEKLA